ncbi:MAG: PAS domain-containing protein [Bacteroidetes bacterium]|nr:PAS domain-containing protein [Bacteroidota bacterium]
MSIPDWTREFPGAITVCDADGIILFMNQKSIATFAADGGADLIGSNVLDCHPEPSRGKLAGLLREHCSNIYTIEKTGRKKLIAQMPWFEDGLFAGIVELSIELPADMPHFIRDAGA